MGYCKVAHAIPKLWVEVSNKDLGLYVNLGIYDHNLIKNCHLYAWDGKQGIMQHFTLLNVQKTYIAKLLWKITLNSKFELGRNIHFSKNVSVDVNLCVSVQHFE